MTSEGRDLDDLSTFKKDMNQSKSATDDSAVFKEGTDLMGAGIGRNIEVFRDLSQKEVTNTSSDKIG
jgi:hypothetical protein